MYDIDKERFAKLFSKYTGIDEEKITEYLKDNPISNLIENTTSLGITVEQLEKVNELKELSSLYNNLKMFQREYYLNDSEEAKAYFCNYFKGIADKEHIAVAFMNNQNKIITTKVLFSGTINEAAVYPREILKEALLCNSNNIILSHNHPGGSLKASNADLDVTRKIINAAKALSIAVRDHIIVGRDKAISMAEEGLLNFMQYDMDTRLVKDQQIDYGEKIKSGNFTKEDIEKYNQLQVDQLKQSLESLKEAVNIKQFEQDLTR